GEDVQRPRSLADEVRRRLEAGAPVHAAARQQRDERVAEEPGGPLRGVARVRVFRREQNKASFRGGGRATLARLFLGTASGAEVLVERREEERQGRFGYPRSRRQRLDEGAQSLALSELGDQRMEDRTVHAKRPGRQSRHGLYVGLRSDAPGKGPTRPG